MTVSIRPFADADRAAAGELLAAAFPDKLAAMVGDFGALRRVLEGGEPGLPFGPELFAALLPAPDPPLAWVAVADKGPPSPDNGPPAHDGTAPAYEGKESAHDGTAPAHEGKESARDGTAPAHDDDAPIVGFLQIRERHTPRHWREHWEALWSHLSLRQAVRAMMFFALFHSASIDQDELLVDTVAVHPEAEGMGVGSALVRFALEEAARRGKTKAMLYCIERNRRARDVYVRVGFRVAYSERLWWAAWLLGFSNSYLMRAPVSAGRTDFS